MTRSGRNTDVVLAAIAATLFDPTIAVVSALLSALYARGKDSKKPLYRMPATDYSRLRDTVYGAINKHTDGIRRALVGYGVPPDDVDRLVHDVVYKGYMDSLIATYA